MIATTPQLGSFISSGEQTTWRLTLDALASGGSGAYRTLYVVSAVGPATAVKAVAACLQGQQTQNRYFYADVPGENGRRTLLRGYPMNVFKHKLGFDQWHLLALADMPQLIPCNTPRALADRLASAEFTTPLLRSWAPWIGKQLIEKKRLIKLDCFRCEAAWLYCDDDTLDKVVADGVRKGELKLDSAEAR